MIRIVSSRKVTNFLKSESNFKLSFLEISSSRKVPNFLRSESSFKLSFLEIMSFRKPKQKIIKMVTLKQFHKIKHRLGYFALLLDFALFLSISISSTKIYRSTF